MELFRLFGSIFINDSDAEKKIGNVDKQGKKTQSTLNGMVNSALKWGVAIASAAGVAAVGMAAFGIKGASNLEAYRNTLNTVMKDTKLAGQTMAWAVEFANKTPFETDSIVEATVRLTAYGLEATKVLPAIGDMASVMNKDIMQAVEAVADAQTGELERMKEFGITKQMIIDEAAEIMKGKEIVNKQGQITDQENFNTALFSLMDKRFKGGMEIQANSFKGLWSTITGTFKTSMAMLMGITATGEVVMGGLFEKLKEKMKLAVDTLDRWSKDGTMDMIQQKATTAISKVIEIVEGFISTIMNATSWVKDHWKIIEPILAGIAAAAVSYIIITKAILAYQAAMKIATAVQLLLNGAMTANPIGLIILAIGLLVAAGIYLYRNWDTVRINFLKIMDSMANGAQSVMSWIKIKILQGIDLILAGYQKMVGFIPGLGELIQSARDKISNLIDTEKVKQDSRALQHEMKQASYAVQLQEIELKKLETAGEDTTEATEALTVATAKETKVMKDNTAAVKAAQEAAQKLRDQQVKSLDTLGSAITTAIRKRYEYELRLQEKNKDTEIQNERTASDKKIAIYQRERDEKMSLLYDQFNPEIQKRKDQIDQLAAQTEAEENALDEQAYQKRLADKQKELGEATAAEDILAIKEELNEMIMERERKSLLLIRRLQTEQLREEIDDLQNNYDLAKDAAEEDLKNKIKNEEEKFKETEILLGKEKTAMQEHYASMLSEESLQAEARLLALDEDNKKVIELLNDYNPQWQDAGQSFGEKLLDGLNSKKASIQSAVNDILSIIRPASAVASSVGAVAKSYVVKAGDTLSAIASMFGSTVSKIAQTNNISNPNLIRVGQKLNIPAYAVGTNYSKGGIALLGEKGPELAELPEGTKVHTANDTQRMLNKSSDIQPIIHTKIEVDGRVFVEATSRPSNDRVGERKWGSGRVVPE